jgi:hypothetical protein
MVWFQYNTLKIRRHFIQFCPIIVYPVLGILISKYTLFNRLKLGPVAVLMKKLIRVLGGRASFRNDRFGYTTLIGCVATLKLCLLINQY